MVKKENVLIKKNSNWGSWTFIVGVIVALIAGFFPLGTALVSVLIMMGILVGVWNISGDETQGFLLAGVSLVIVSSLGANTFGEIAFVGKYLNNIMSAVQIFVTPATVVAALKQIYNLAHN
ncbi:MAG: hypothetical protein Q7R52_02915 [archaeon]|nr:hypothetical protein [archaeon]